MKRLSLLLVTLLASGACAAETFYDTATITAVKPNLVEVSRQVQVCEVAPAHAAAQPSLAGGILGGVLGGVAGHQVGNGSGNTAATIAGAITGAMLGEKVTSTSEGTNCHVESQQATAPNGYLVTYNYHGHTYTTIAPTAPKGKLAVQVNLSPEF